MNMHKSTSTNQKSNQTFSLPLSTKRSRRGRRASKLTSHILSLLLAILLTCPILSGEGGLPLSMTASAAGQVIADGTYAILLHDDQSKCLNDLFASTAEDKAQLGVDPFNHESNEIWIIVNRGDGYVTISPSHAPNLCINALLANKTPGDYLTLHGWTEGDAASLWLPIRNSDGSYTFRNKATNLVIDCKDGSYTTGNKFLSWTKNGYARAQSFYLKQLSGGSDSASSSLKSGTYAILLHDDQNKCLNDLFASTVEDKAQLGVDPFNHEANEIWIITVRDNNYVTISPSHAPNLCINALLANKTPGDYLTLHGWTEGDAASLWLPILNADGSYTFRNKATNLVIDCKDGSYTTGNKFLSWTKNGYARAQSFYLKEVTVDTWVYPMTNTYVCGNDWSEYYSPRAKAGRPDHVGIDIASSSGSTAICAAADGYVESVGTNSSNGKYVIIRHTLNGKTVYSFYAHLSKITVSARTTVSKGTQVGVLGGSGSSSDGTHLHFAVTDTLWSNGGYYGYVSSFSGNKVTYGGVTFYNPHYVVEHNALPN